VAQQRCTLSHSGILLSEETAIGLLNSGFSRDLEVTIKIRQSAVHFVNPGLN